MRALIRDVAVLVVAAALHGCGARGSTPVDSPTPRVEVVASVFPLAELAGRVGLNRVRVTDLSATAAGSATAGAIDRAAVVLVVGQGFQPDIERAAAGHRNLIMIGPTDGGDVRLWLDPFQMPQLATRVAESLSRVDPARASAYQAAAKVYNGQLDALEIDYRTSLADCARRDLVTADGAFGRLAKRYGLVVHTIGDADTLKVLATRRATTIFTEPLAPAGPALALAQRFHVRTQLVDTLEGRTPSEVHRGATYLSLMTDNLARLRAAQSCTGSNPT